MADSYDVIVLGGGAPGEHCAAALAEGGLRVAVVERERVGGECSYWACIPSKTLLRPGEAVQGAREAAATAEVDVAAALAWRDFMVSDYSDAGAERWLTGRGSTCCAAPAGSPGRASSRSTACRTPPSTWCSRPAPTRSSRPSPACASSRASGAPARRPRCGAIPRRLVVLGGGAAGVELAQATHRLGAEVALVESAPHLLAREPAPLGEALADALRRDGVEVVVGIEATGARREGDDYVLALADGRELRGERLLVATGRRPRVDAIGLETVGVEADPRGVHVDARLRAAEGLWAIGDINGIWPLTHVGEYEGDIVAANILGEPREAHYDAVPRVVYTDPQAGRGRRDARRAFSATYALADVPKTATYTRAYAESNGFLTLLSDGERLTGAYALGPEAGEWLQQATLAIRARVPLDVLRDTIQPFPSFSEIHAFALKALRGEIAGRAADLDVGRA